MSNATPAPAPAPAPSSSAPPAGGNAFASASLYVGDLSPEVTEATLFELFNEVGPVASVRVCRDAATRRSLGYAYVNFHRVDDAERALDTMNFSEIRGKPCRIMWSQRDPTLRRSGAGNIFVKNLAKSIDNKALYDTFSIFGNVLSCKVAQNSKGENLGYGFVHYETAESAQNAIKSVNGMMIADQQVSVQAFKSKRERGGGDKNNFTNIYVKNLPDGFSQEKMDALFAPFGKITSSVLCMDKEEKSRGFGFVNMENNDEAKAAVDALNGKEIDGKKLFVGRAQKKEEREKELRERFEQLRLERQKKYAGVNLYVKNLADEVDDDRLRSEFSKFGAITSTKVMRDPSGKSRGFGFVCFSSAEEATKAVTEMNGKMIDAKPLYVALAQRKEFRRAQLEAQYAARAKMGGMGGPQMYPPQGPPMFYPPQAVPRMMYAPQQLVPAQRRWAQAQQGGGRPPMMPAGPMNYMGMQPVAGGRGGRGGGRGGQRMPQQQGAGGRGGKPINGQGFPQQQMAGPGGRGRGGPAQPGFKYTAQVRNQNVQQVPQQGQSMAGGPQQQKALTIQALAAAPVEQQKQMIGERLFPLIQQQQPQLAGKITGMLLEMDNGELLHLLESQEALSEKIDEALTVLNQAAGDSLEEGTQQEGEAN